MRESSDPKGRQARPAFAEAATRRQAARPSLCEEPSGRMPAPGGPQANPAGDTGHREPNTLTVSAVAETIGASGLCAARNRPDI
jgi:hypothetical protein